MITTKGFGRQSYNLLKINYVIKVTKLNLHPMIMERYFIYDFTIYYIWSKSKKYKTNSVLFQDKIIPFIGLTLG